MSGTSDAGRPIRIAAAGDVHCDEASRDRIAESFAAIAADVDLILLAGDLTTTGEPEQATALASACARLDQPILAVLGNHDWHADRRDELVAALGDGGIDVIDPGSKVLELRGTRIGVAATKGFIGGFAGSSHLPDFGEPSLRRIYSEGSAEVEALDRGLREIATCDLRVALLHYSPTADTLIGEPPGIQGYLGSDRLAAPILEHEPDFALHGHAHAGTIEGRIGSVPVYNVAVQVMEGDFWFFELEPSESSATLH
ncbi:MAG TPA: metallophosphoesterase [Solirubrobacterales bacterium]